MKGIQFALVILGLFVVLLSGGIVIASGPSGANITNTPAPQATPSNATPASNNAQAGNITELTLFGVSPTMSWQGYFGNVSGTIQLANANSKVMYNWSIASPQGEVYASTNSTIQWATIQCFNFTATGAYNTTDETGTTNLKGRNLTQLHEDFDINASDVDSVNNTFSLIGGTTHDAFYTGSKTFSEGACQSTRIFDNTGAGVNNRFEEVLLYEPNTDSTVFTALLEKDEFGFDNSTHDFEMMVLENGHMGDVNPMQYYFFVELA